MEPTYYPVFDLRVVENGSYVDGKKDGVWIGKSEHGFARTSVFYTNGIRDGSITVRYTFAQVNYKVGLYVNGTLMSPIHIYKEGELFAYDHFEMNGDNLARVHRENLIGHKHGRETVYYEGTSNVKIDRMYNNGVLHGEQYEYYPCQSLKKMETYEHGVLHGPTYHYSTSIIQPTTSLILTTIIYQYGEIVRQEDNRSTLCIDQDMDPIVEPISEVCSITMEAISGCYYKCTNPIKTHYYEKSAIISWMTSCCNDICPYDKTYKIDKQLYSTEK